MSPLQTQLSSTIIEFMNNLEKLYSSLAWNPHSPMYSLPQDILCMIFIKLPLGQIIICRLISKPFHHLLTSPHFLNLISNLPFPLLALCPPLHDKYYRLVSPPPVSLLHAFDHSSNQWLKFDLTFLPFTSLFLVTSSPGCIYLWGESPDSPFRSLVVCNPLTRAYRVLPKLGSAWSKNGSVLAGSSGRVFLFTQFATLYRDNHNEDWLKLSTNLRCSLNETNLNPRRSIFVGSSVYALCWRHMESSCSDIITCKLPENETTSLVWSLVKKKEWGVRIDILRYPKLLNGVGNKILLVGAEKKTMLINDYAHLAILILRLDLESLEWEEAGRMPYDMYKCFEETILYNKYFGGGDKVYFSTPGGRLAVWDDSAKGVIGGGSEWRWIEGAPDFGDGLSRGFVFNASLSAMP